MAEDKKEQQQPNVDDQHKESEDDKQEKVYMTAEEVNEVVKERLKRDRENRQKKSQDKQSEDISDKSESKSEDNSRVISLEQKLVCYEAGVNKDSVPDVIALAKAYTDEDTDFEQAVEKVLKKYPTLAKVSSGEKEEQKENWGKRQSENTSEKKDGVTQAFLKRNPNLKID